MGGSEKSIGATPTGQPAGQASPRAQEVSAKGDHQAQGAVREIRFIHDGEWAQICLRGGRSLCVYPREDGTFSIGRPEASPTWRDLDGQTGFANMQAAIDQAVWLGETPDMLRRVWL